MKSPFNIFIKRYFNIKRNINLLNAYWNNYRKNIIITNYPIQAFIEPTANCNLRCPLCPTGLRLHDRHTGILSFEKFKSLIDEIGDYIYILHMYNWGEPTLHKDFPKMIKYASDKGIITTTSSNFSLKLDEGYLKDIVYSGLDTLILSIDGITQETYSRYRKGGNLSIVLENLKKLHNIKKETNINTPIIKWNFFVFKHNEYEIEELKKIYKEFGADELLISSAYISKHSEEIQSPSNQLYKSISVYNTIFSKTCSQLYYSFVYNPDNYISPCCSISSVRFDFLKYENNGVKNALNSEKFIEARKLTKNKKYYDKNKNIMDGLVINLMDNVNICSQCPTPSIQNCNINIIHYFISDTFNLIIKKYVSEKIQNYIKSKYYKLIGVKL